MGEMADNEQDFHLTQRNRVSLNKFRTFRLIYAGKTTIITTFQNWRDSEGDFYVVPVIITTIYNHYYLHLSLYFITIGHLIYHVQFLSFLLGHKFEYRVALNIYFQMHLFPFKNSG